MVCRTKLIDHSIDIGIGVQADIRIELHAILRLPFVMQVGIGKAQIPVIVKLMIHRNIEGFLLFPGVYSLIRKIRCRRVPNGIIRYRIGHICPIIMNRDIGLISDIFADTNGVDIPLLIA